MPFQRTPAVDPVFAGVVEAIYGEDVDPREVLEKATPDGSDLHTDQALGVKRAKRQRNEAITGLGATGIAGVAGVDAIRSNLKEAARKVKVAQGIHVPEEGPGAIARVIGKVPGMTPKKAAIAVGGGLLALHGVELTSDALGAHAQLKQLKQAQSQLKPPQPAGVAKAFRLRALNPGVAGHVPSLRARRPRLNPVAPGGLFQPVGKASTVSRTDMTVKKIAMKQPGLFRRKSKPWKSKVGILGDYKQAGLNISSGAANVSAATNQLVDMAGKLKALKPSIPGALLGTGAVLGGAVAASGAGGWAGRKLAERGNGDGSSRKAKKLVARHQDSVEKAWFLRGVRATAHTARQATEQAQQASKEAYEASNKINALIPDAETAKKVVRRVAIGGGATIAGASGIGAYTATRHQNKRGPQYVMVKKSFLLHSLADTLNTYATMPSWRVMGSWNNAVRSAKAARATAKAPGAVGNATRAVNDAMRTTAENTKKFNEAIPDAKKVKRAGLTTAAIAGATGGTVIGGAAYSGNRRGRERIIVVPTKKPRNMAPQADAVAKAGEVTWTAEIAKVDADKRQVFGWASVSEISGRPVVDLQGDIVPIEETEKAAYRYVLESRKGGDMHARVTKGFDSPKHTADMIESFVVTPEKLSKMGLPADALPHGWWVGFHVNDDAQWAMVKSGERTGFSIHGSGTRTPVSKASPLDGAPRRMRQVRALTERAKFKPGDLSGELTHEQRLSALGLHRDLTPYSSADFPSHSSRRLRPRGYGPDDLEKMGPEVKNWDTYHALRRKGHSKESAARITNSIAKADDTKDDKTDKARAVARRGLGERISQAIHPPPVKLVPVKSAAVNEMGYQGQTRRLTYRMHSGDRKYTYKVPPATGDAAVGADSKGRYYATQVRGKAKRSDRVGVTDRVRLFLDPVSKRVLSVSRAGV
jgi:hypothetical protein